jgi:hypothetical protein
MGTPPEPGRTWIPYVIAILAAVLAVAVARRRAEHRPVAMFLGVMVAIDLARLARRYLYPIDAAPHPHVGLARLVFHADEAGFLAWPFGLVALALVIFGARRPWPVLVAYLVTLAGLVALYPSPYVRTDGLQRVYLAAFLASFMVYIAALARWGALRATPSSEHAAFLILGALDLARLLAFRGSIFEQWAAYALPVNAVCYGLISAVQGGFLWAWSRS